MQKRKIGKSNLAVSPSGWKEADKGPVDVVSNAHASVGHSRMTGKQEVGKRKVRGGATMILPGETEAGSAGKQPCRG